MTIYLNEQGTRTLEIAVTDDSYRYRAIRGEDALTLHFSSAEPVEIPVGAWTQFEDGRYELVQPGNFRKNGTRNFEYTLVMESAQAQLRKYKFRNVVDGRLEFSLTARPREHLQMLIDNLNLRETGWTAGECIDAVEKTISYNHTGCMEALNQMADEFSTEYEITGKTICLCRVEYNKDNPLPLSYGRGKGFLPGVGRSNFGDSQPVEVLFVQGGEQNINPAQYGNKKLLLPRSAALKYDGAHFEGETGYNASAAHAYTTDAAGLSLRRSDRGLQTKVEDSLDCTHIYPQRVGTAQVDAAAGTPCVFTDRSIPAGLDYSQCTVPGETMTVIFQSGMLAGREFEAQYRHDGRRFELTPQEIDGFTMPGEAFKPASGDTYAVFHIAMPGAYICDDPTRSGASWDMFREAVKYLWDNEQPKFTFSGVLDGIWAGKNWLDIGGRLRPGGYILFSDDQFQKEGIPIRIVGIRDSVDNPHSPEIELSNQPVGGSFASQLSKIGQTEVVIGDQYRKGVEYTKRRFRDSQQTISMLSEAMLDNFTRSISPVSVQTMSALVGDQSLQFRFVNNRTKPQEVPHEVAYDKQTRRLTVPRGLLQHMTLDIYTFAPSHKASEYKFWDLPAFTTPPLEDDKRYYLYAKVSTMGTAGSFRVSEQAIAMEGEAGCYHLLMGVLNSAFEGERSYVSLYGFTEVLPGRITTNKIVSTDGKTYFDLAEGEIGGNIKFTSTDGSLKDVTDLETMIGDRNKVHTEQPIPPYQKGDLWVDGKVLRKCITTRETGYYTAADWVLAVAYDSTKTTIDGGLVTSGTLQLAGSDSTIKAGITGEGTADTSVRVWAGAGKANCANAPFRVLQDGSMYATKGVFAGFLQIPFKKMCDAAIYNGVKDGCDCFTVDEYFNLETHPVGTYMILLNLPKDRKYDGVVLNVFDYPIKTRSSSSLLIRGEEIYHPSNLSELSGFRTTTEIDCVRGGFIQFICIEGNWVVTCDMMPEAIVK